MLLPKEKINRFLRHIIMPEISGPGQKKLIESKGLVVSPSPESAIPLVFYLAALGIENLYCYFKSYDEYYFFLKENLKDFNPDLKLFFLSEEEIESSIDELDFCVFFDEFFVPEKFKEVPAVFALTSPWRGIIKTSKGATFLEEEDLLFPESLKKISENSPGKILSRCFSGAICSIEAAKLVLKIGKTLDSPLYYDLLNMDFTNTFEPVNTEEPALFEENNFYELLSKAKVLIVGTGGLGSPAALALTLAGVGTIGLVDSDNVEISNLNRQILHSTSRINMPKVDSAEIFLKKLNPKINIIKYHTRFTLENSLEIVKDYDVVIDGVDNLPTRYLLNDVCVISKKPLAEAGVLRFEGLGMTIVPGKGPCYRCVFPKMPPAGSIPSCSETGILGPVPGVLGFIEATETVKIITGAGKLLKGRLVFFDSMDLDFRTPEIKNNPECPVCGQNPSIKDLKGEYGFICENNNIERED
ncbi:HesA/MoeB/ThiF family protein [Thermovenabulum gondwanense]|uniref:Putative adenylyltransferase/sulfurtransferase MoeZ n=1 Tax=Thermovenabulum gondwanense TaxID=520767 RepID=A0A162M3W0_9FIRM|nr:HesA/MoeB/ThiF family protein [Thermovenabulum gondwanense]KYO63813.1 putative adenylyltransferase/sulfurtransferase MoeZ [Thermovenabulum gondwanense]